jgi:ATPase subunit of ABC transporter with duplicated ATPase domains
MRVALIGAWLSEADFLILDEPSNHLDRAGRQALIEQLRRWPRGLIVVSHDRQLLASMARIAELSALGLRSYGGDYSFYASSKAHDRRNALDQLEQSKRERKRKEQAMREQTERQARRKARGDRHARTAIRQRSCSIGRRRVARRQRASCASSRSRPGSNSTNVCGRPRDRWKSTRQSFSPRRQWALARSVWPNWMP